MSMLECAQNAEIYSKCSEHPQNVNDRRTRLMEEVFRGTLINCIKSMAIIHWNSANIRPYITSSLRHLKRLLTTRIQRFEMNRFLTQFFF